jgi:DNA-binding response OmpR family regulator
MDTRFEDFSAKILLVEPSANVRGMISDVIKSMGFSSIQAMDSVKSALGYLEVENVDWLIMPLQAAEPVNALQAMRIINAHEKFKETVTTLLLDEKETVHLPKAFELGLLSWHSKGSLTKDGLIREFKDLIETLKTHQGNKVFTSFEYLQVYLRSTGNADLLLEASQDLVTSNPVSPFAVFNLALNQLALGRRDDALRTLGNAKASDVSGWEKFAKENLSDGEEVQLRLPIKRVLVVDPDESIHNQIKETLSKHSDKPDIRFEVDGESAIKWAEANPSLDLVIQEWRIPGLTGHVFLQRMRKISAKIVPVIVLSSLLKREDVPILNEMSVSTGIEKPLDEKVFVKTVFNAILQHSSPTAPKWIERKIQEKLNLKDNRAVQKLYKRLGESPLATEDQRFYLQALRFYHAGDYESAKTLCAKAIQLGGDQIKTFTLLGRCLNNLRDFNGAIKCFERAQTLSPKNIERLCEIAEAQVEAGNEEAAKEALDQAKGMDANSETVVGSEAKIEISKGNIERARELMFHMGSIEELISDMNGSAVAWVRVGQFQKGVDLYNKTLEAVQADDHVTRTRVLYNLALAFARQGDLPSAKMTVDRAKLDVDHPVREKITSLKAKVEKSLGANAAIKLRTNASAAGSDVNPWEIEAAGSVDLISADPVILDSQTGPLKSVGFDRCIMGIIRLPESVREVSDSLLKGRPLFNLRSAIERTEGMGAEKIAQEAG